MNLITNIIRGSIGLCKNHIKEAATLNFRLVLYAKAFSCDSVCTPSTFIIHKLNDFFSHLYHHIEVCGYMYSLCKMVLLVAPSALK